MNRRLSLYLFPSVIAVMFSLAGSAKACLPIGGIEPPCSAYWKADSVFVGKISGIKTIRRESKDSFYTLLLRFSVKQVYRGAERKEIEILTTATECDAKYRKGQEWLVYTRLDPRVGRLVMWPRSSMNFEMSEDLAYIYDVSHGHVESSIIVRAFNHPNDKLQGIRIEIEGNSAKYEGVTDSEGGLTIPISVPGRYLVRGIFPPQTYMTLYMGMPIPTINESRESKAFEYQVEIKSGQCAYKEFVVNMPGKNSSQH